MNMICKAQVEGVAKGEVKAEVEFVLQIFGIVAQLDLGRVRRLFFASFCNRAIPYGLCRSLSP